MQEILNNINFTTKSEEQIKIIHKMLTPSDNKSDINIELQELKKILLISKNMELVVKQTLKKNAIVFLLQNIMKELQDIHNIQSIVVTFKINPKHPFIHLAEGMEVLENSLNKESIIFFSTRVDTALEIDYAKILVLVIYS